MAVLSNHKKVGAGFSNDAELVRVEYNFANDTGAVADYDAFTADGACLVEFLGADCQTAITGTATANMDLGKGAGGVEFLSALDVGGGISVDVQTAPATAGLMVDLADGEKIVMGIDTEAVTAGKLVFLFKVYAR